jgi:O-antigen ligase
MMKQNNRTNQLELWAKYPAVIFAFAIPISTAMMSVFGIAAGVLSLASGNYAKKFKLTLNNRVVLLALLFFALFVIGIVYSTASFPNALYVLKKHLKLLLIPFLLPLFTEEKWRKYAVNAFLAAVMLAVFLSYVKYFQIVHIKYWEKWGGVSMFYSHIQYSFSLAIAGYLLMQKVFSHHKYRWVYAIALALLGFNLLFLCAGRSGYVIFYVLIILFCWQKLSWKGLPLGCLIVAILFALSFNSSPVFKTRTGLLNPTSLGLSAKERITFWVNSLKIIKKHPIIGTGTGSFRNEYIKVRTASQPMTTNPHNEYLYVAVQFGIVGLLVLLLLLYFQWRDSFSLPTNMRMLAQAMLVAIAVGSLFNSWLLDNLESNFFVLFTALSFAALSMQSKTKIADKSK